MTHKGKVSKRISDYTDFLRSLELSTIALSEAAIKGDREKYLHEPNHSISMGWTSKPIISGRQHFDVVAELMVNVSKPKSQSHFLELKAKYLLHIHCAKEFPPEYVNRFCDSEVRLMVWPYFREYVTSTCGRMHIPPVFLPLATLGNRG